MNDTKGPYGAARALLLLALALPCARIAYAQDAAPTPPVQARVLLTTRTGWHLHPVPSLAYGLDGEPDVTLKSGETRHLHAGDAFAEVVDTLHNGHNPSPQQAARLIVFYDGKAGTPLTVTEQDAGRSAH